jgi:F1F0 ATPase subunit 2
MNEITALTLALLGGVCLGMFFFGGLWWTIRHGVRSSSPAAWFLGSLLLRTTVAVGGIYFISHKDWRPLIACMLGFLLARVWIVHSSYKRTPNPKSESTRARP